MSAMIDYYYNINNTVFDNLEKVIKINIKNNINFDKITRKI